MTRRKDMNAVWRRLDAALDHHPLLVIRAVRQLSRAHQNPNDHAISIILFHRLWPAVREIEMERKQHGLHIPPEMLAKKYRELQVKSQQLSVEV